MGMSKNLVIVESPAKAKTIEGYLGKNYKVASSYGHVRDLPKGNKAIDIENGFTPTYEVLADKKQVITELKGLCEKSEMVFLATDDDREGEAISWHLKEALSLDDAQTRRIVFREITKNAINNAIQTPRGIDIDLVNAQQARRVLDRLVGFELSPVLWKKIKNRLSAGRVQSVAVRIIVDREREINKFNAKSYYRIMAFFKLDKGKELKAELSKKFDSEKDAYDFLTTCLESTFSIKSIETKPLKKSPAPPFTTSTLQQEASRKLGFSVVQTMVLAQRLYEAGKISYMRTDSLSLSQEAIQSATTEINKEYGSKFIKVRHYKTKSSNAQEAHEAIRPTDFSLHETGGERKEQRLYELIWKRTIASQMASAQLEKTTATIAISASPETFIAIGEVIKFEGFLKVYIESTNDEEKQESYGMLPPLEINQILDLNYIKARQSFTRPAARYTEASLVKKLEEMGIGRPSTYVPTISTVQKRDYVFKESREGHERKYVELKLKDKTINKSENVEITGTEKNKLFPTNTAMVVNDFLVDRFPNVIDFAFTARIEKEFDEIARGSLSWNKMIKVFYTKFHDLIEKTENVDRSEVGSTRKIGIDPKSGKPVIARLGPFGPLIQIGNSDDEDKPRYGKMRKDQFIESITLEEALDIFKLPRVVGEFEDKEIVAAIGRFGPYIRHDGMFVSIPKDEDPLEITANRSIDLIKAKRKADADKFIKDFPENPDVRILKGRWGPYIKVAKKNVKIPKEVDPKDLTLEKCLEMAEKAPYKKRNTKKNK